MPRVRGLLAVLFLLSGAFAGQPGAQPSNPGVSKEAVETIVRDYLLENPEVILEALDAYKRRQSEAEDAAVRQALAARSEELFEDPHSAVGGNPQGDVTLVEFFDYRCGVCKRVHPVVAELMERDGGIRRVYKEWPILGPDSVFASRAALAARRQGDEKYLAFHDAMMEASGALKQETVLGIAAAVGLDSKRLLADLEAPEIARTLQRNFSLAKALRLNGTPSFIIGDTVLRGARDIDALLSIVREARRKR